MASLWTPGGEHRVPPGDDPSDQTPVGPASREQDESGGIDEAAVRAELAELERELLAAPVESIVANHCYGFFQLAALHLSQRPPHLDEARIAVDALAAVVDGLGERLGTTLETLRDALAQIRLAYVQITAAQPTANGNDAAPSPTDSTSS